MKNGGGSARGLRAQVAETFDGIIAKAHAAHKEAVAQKKRFDDPLDQAQRHLKLLMITYDHDQQFIGVFDSGMTLRDWLAGMALRNCNHQGSVEWLASEAYRMADAMLKEREK